jgi:hypothetical protein
MQHTIILCPLYNDEISFNIFAAEIEKQLNEISDEKFSFLIVNDGTHELKLQSKLPIIIIHLNRNIGHQKAIALGLAYAHHHLTFNQIIVMDCDGEDKPEDVVVLLDKARTDSRIIVAKRIRRQEGTTFQFFYRIYKLMFFILTGKRISFGNFMLLPKKAGDKIVHYSEIWNHLAGTIIKSKIPCISIETHRGKRYEGNSKMNFTDLLLHGLGAIGVFIEIIASRLLIFSLLMIAISVIAILIILFIKLFTVRAIPGWATTALSSMLIVLLQSFLLSLFTIFLYLSFQSQRKFIPALHFMDYVQSVEILSNE